MEKKSIGGFIAVLRKAKGMTQQDLAIKLNVSNKTVSKWECDETYPDISLIPIIAEVLEVSCDELLKGDRILHAVNEEKSDKKITKQLKHLVDKNIARFKLITILNIMFIILGGLVNFIVSYSAYRPDIGFWVMVGVIIVGITLEIIALMLLNGKFSDKELFHNNGIDLEKTVNIIKYKYSFAVFYISFFLMFLTLPLILARLFAKGIVPVKSVLSFNYYVERLLYFIIVPILSFCPLQSLYKTIFIKCPTSQINKKMIVFDFIQLLFIVFSHAFYRYYSHESDYLEEWDLVFLFTVSIIVTGPIFLFCFRKSIAKDKRFNMLMIAIRNMTFLFIPRITPVFLNYLLIITTTTLSFVKEVNFKRAK